MCRSRRTKCDGRKPACAFCESHDIQCTYISTGPPVSRHDAEISAIKEDLDRLCGLLSIGLVGQEARIFEQPPGYLPELPPLREYPLDESIISRHWRREFPFMTIQTPSMLCLLELNPKLASQLVARERTDVSTLALPSEVFGFGFQYEHAILAFGAFYDRIHHWYPILPSDTFDYYRETIAGLLVPSAGSCLVLLVAAIGSITACPSLTAAYELRPDSQYISKALGMLPNVLSEFTLTSVQCLVLLSIYYCSMAKPCQAHDYILIASSRAQAMFKWIALMFATTSRLLDDDENKIDLLRRSFWSILLIETFVVLIFRYIY
ncbi:Echinocandin B biosynthetic cluster transcription factor [Hyphodiscus hymeniophilus]|uniref:Echinocandin B biosynthetic cluster transcription factor n=1 Tax=Hyphodiscus hymeniophilus TaxID=353542 RepID=A0A9P6SKE4_9HELO|nr:Echinocandin B biosynthetic cluster transcription factor [Hyphodiscus hymeniophilus]